MSLSLTLATCYPNPDQDKQTKKIKTKHQEKAKATTSGLQKMKMNLCPETESVSPQKKRAIMEELVKGQEAATQLRVLLHNPFETDLSLSSHHLIAKVLTSFTQALSVINSSPLLPGSADGLAYQNLLLSGENGWSVPRSSNCPTSGDCSEKRSQKGGRGRYSRRLTCHILFLNNLSFYL